MIIASRKLMNEFIKKASMFFIKNKRQNFIYIKNSMIYINTSIRVPTVTNNLKPPLKVNYFFEILLFLQHLSLKWKMIINTESLEF